MLMLISKINQALSRLLCFVILFLQFTFQDGNGVSTIKIFDVCEDYNTCRVCKDSFQLCLNEMQYYDSITPKDCVILDTDCKH